MTPKQIRALADAEDAINHRGLERTVAGWLSTRPGASVTGYHAFNTVNSLVAGGYLALWGKGKKAVAHITDGGQMALASWRERVAK